MHPELVELSKKMASEPLTIERAMEMQNTIREIMRRERMYPTPDLTNATDAETARRELRIVEWLNTDYNDDDDDEEEGESEDEEEDEEGGQNEENNESKQEHKPEQDQQVAKDSKGE